MLAQPCPTTSVKGFQRSFGAGFSRLWKVGLVLAGLLALWLLREPALHWVAVIKDREALVRQVHAYGAWGPLVLSSLTALQVIVAVLPGHILMVAGGYLYGALGGFLVNWIPAVAASQLNFHLARSAGRRLVYRLAPAGMVERWEALARGKGFTFYLVIFALPIFPGDLMCYVAGFTQISPRRFLAANLLGHVPFALSAALVGAYGASLPPQVWVVVAVLATGAALLWRRFGARLTTGLRQRIGLFKLHHIDGDDP